MKGEFMGADGQTYHIDSIALKEVCSEPSATISGSLDGGARLVWKLHLHPSHPDFTAAVAALQALIRPSLHPWEGRVRAMREVMSDGIPEEVLRAFTERFGGEYRRLARWPWTSLWHYNGPRP